MLTMDSTDKIYGNDPISLGTIIIDTDEMMFWLYCPIKIKGGQLCIPDNLKKFQPIIDVVKEDSSDRWDDSYVYITAKTLWVNPENPGNRPGWHSDGFLTDDVNYVWCDKNPTVFYYDGNKYSFTKDHVLSLDEMETVCSDVNGQYRSSPYELLKLDETVLHKIDTNIEPGFRTFLKISVSHHEYRLKGNSINHQLTGNWCDGYRTVERNCPVSD